MPLNAVTASGFYRFDFLPLTNSDQQYYYAILEVEGDGSLWVGASGGNTYLNGALYQSGLPRDGQLTFALEYETLSLALGLIQEVLQWLGILFIAGFIFILPGWALLTWLLSNWQQLRWMEKLGLSAGMSLSLHALLLLYTDLVGLHLGAGYTWGPSILGLVLLLWKGFAKGGLRSGIQSFFQGIRAPHKTLIGRLPELTLVVLLGMIIALRFWVIRDVEAPMWGDSVHHTFITQLILDADGLFESWQPYAPYATFSNQYGFPAAGALLSWATGMDALRAVLWSGQVLNVLAIIAMLPLALKLAKGGRWVAVGTVLAAGLLSSMPAYYVNWGRYAQLAGQVVLPVALWLLWAVIEDFQEIPGGSRLKALPWKKIFLAGFALAGMVLYQYRTPYFYLAFILACVFGWWLPVWRFNFQRWGRAILGVSVVIILGVIIFLPWGVRLKSGNVGDLATASVSGATLYEGIRSDYQAWKNILNYVPALLLGGALVGWILGLGKRIWSVFTVGLWAIWMASIQAWTLLGVPGALQVPSFSVLISLYLPLALLFGWLVGQIAGALGKKPAFEIAWVCIILFAGVWYAWSQRNLATSQSSAMVTRPDMRAMTWIRANTRQDARFLVEGFSAFFDTSAVGSDAGWWIPLLARRANMMPPLYALSSETPIDADYSERVIDLVTALETISLDTIEGAMLLCDEGISHIYIGQQQGLVGITWVEQSFSPQELVNQPYYDLVYHQDRVYIFELRTEICSQ